MQRTRTWGMTLVVVVGWTGFCLGASPATPTSIGIESALSKIQVALSHPDGKPNPISDSWDALAGAIRHELKNYAAANSPEDRQGSLEHLWQSANSISGLTWPPAVELHNEMLGWLQPRWSLTLAERALINNLKALPPTTDAAVQKNRDLWEKFVRVDLGASLREFEGAADIRGRRAAMAKIYGGLNALQAKNMSTPWPPAVALETALQTVFNGPNLQATADAASVSPKLANYVVESGPITRNGQTSYVTAGEYLGFGLMWSDDGIAFYNRQALSSVTPVNGFQNQIASDSKGKRAAKMYYFNATTYDQSIVTMIAVLRSSGLQLFPENSHSVSARIASSPQPGGGLARGIAGLLGQNQKVITQKVYDGAIGEIRAGVVQGSKEEAAERSAVRVAQTNAEISKVLVGGDRAVVKDFQIDNLRLRSRPEFILVDGRLTWRGGPDQAGATFAKPSKFSTASPGIAADVDLASILTNLVSGYFQGEEIRSIDNIMIETKKVAPNAPPAERMKMSKNVDYETFRKSVAAARAANDPAVLTVRVKKPGRPPQFSVDRNGFLVAIIHDFQLEVPAPDNAAKGGAISGPPAQIYRLIAPHAEFAVSFQVMPGEGGSAPRVSGRIEGFDAGPGSMVIALNENESNPATLTAFMGQIVLNFFGNRIKNQKLDTALEALNIPGYVLTSVSPLDPTGWMRIVVSQAPGAPVAAPAVASSSSSGIAPR